MRTRLPQETVGADQETSQAVWVQQLQQLANPPSARQGRLPEDQQVVLLHKFKMLHEWRHVLQQLQLAGKPALPLCRLGHCCQSSV